MTTSIHKITLTLGLLIVLSTSYGQITKESQEAAPKEEEEVNQKPARISAAGISELQESYNLQALETETMHTKGQITEEQYQARLQKLVALQARIVRLSRGTTDR